jgi:hypothetical protein
MIKQEKQKEIENIGKIQIGDTTFSGLTDDKMVEAYRHYANSKKLKYICISACFLVVLIKLLFFVN